MKFDGCVLGLCATFISLLDSSMAFGEAAQDSPILYIHAGRLLADPVDGRVMLRKTLVIKDGKVMKIEDGYTEAPDVQIVDLSEAFVMPGMIDGHVHLSYREGRESLAPTATSPSTQAIVGTIDAKNDLLAGFTTVVDLGGENEVVFALREASKAI